MRTFFVRGVLAVALVLAPMSVIPVAATHGGATAYVYIKHGDVTPANYSNSVNFNGDSTSITVSLGGKRDYNRFVRWCGTDNFNVYVAANTASGNHTCFGPSTWQVYVEVRLYPTTATHTSMVTVTVNATP